MNLDRLPFPLRAVVYVLSLFERCLPRDARVRSREDSVEIIPSSVSAVV